MEIDWRTLDIGTAPLDYFCVTVRSGRVVNQRVYYATEGFAVETAGAVFAALADRGYIDGFSYGMDSSGVEKFDFNVKAEYAAQVYAELDHGFDFFDRGKVDMLNALFDGHGINIDNRIIGVKRADEEIVGITVYYKVAARSRGANMPEFMRDIAAAFGAGISPRALPHGAGSVLQLAAIDFSKNVHALKLYFKFDENYDFSELMSCFAETENEALAADILGSNGFVEGYRIAYDGITPSHNFYIKK